MTSLDCFKCNTTNINWRSWLRPSRLVSSGRSELLALAADRDKARHVARDVAKVSLLLARHILAGAHGAAMKEDGLELLYDDADFL